MKKKLLSLMILLIGFNLFAVPFIETELDGRNVNMSVSEYRYDVSQNGSKKIVNKEHLNSGYLETFFYENDVLVYYKDSTGYYKSYKYKDGKLIEIDDCYYPTYYYYENDLLVESKDKYYDIKYEYNSSNQLIKQSYDETVILYEYNSNNQLISKTSNKKTTFYEYDKKGNLIKEEVPNDSLVLYEYDSEDRCIKSIWYLY